MRVLPIMRAGGALAWRSGSSVLIYALIFGLTAGFVVMPPLLRLLRTIGQFDGYSIVGNYAILPWILSGRGVVWALLLLTSTLFLLVLFLAGLFLLFAREGDTRGLRKRFLSDLWRRLPEILWVSTRWSLVAVVVAIVLGLMPCIGFVLFLSDHDINYYLTVQPPQWWLVIGISAVWIAVLGFMILRALLRISLSFPLWVRRPSGGLRACVYESWALTRGHERRYALLAACTVGLVLLVHMLFILALFQAVETLLPLAASSMRGTLCVIGGGILLFVLEAFAALCTCLAWLCAIWSVLGEECCPAPATTTPAAATTRQRVRALRALALVGASAVLVVFVFQVVVKLPPPPPSTRTLVIAHRGGAGEAPENSREAVRLALSRKRADMLELDVAMTADGVLILAHDSDLMRQAGEPRKLAVMDWEEIRTLRLQSPQSRGSQQSRVARLDDVLDRVGRKRPVILEFKHSRLTPELVPATVTLVRKHGLMDRILFMSLDLADIRAVQALAPEAKVGYFVSIEMGNYMNLNLNCIAPRHTLVTRKLVSAAKARGIPLFAWTVDDPVRIVELLELGVDGIITNEPTRVRKLVDAYFMIPADARALLRFRRLWDFLLERREFKNLAELAM